MIELSLLIKGGVFSFLHLWNKQTKKWVAWFLIVLCYTFIYIDGSPKLEYKQDLDGLHPQVKKVANQLIADAKAKGIKIVIYEGYRSWDEQDELYKIGRQIRTSEKPVTNARGGESFHNFGLAFDFALIEPITNDISWDIKRDANKNGKSDWFEVAEIGKRLGLSWGGDWKQIKDYPHFEMTFGKSLKEWQKTVREQKKK